MKTKLLQAIRPHIPYGARLLLGVSGGPDSMALLHLLQALQEELSLTLFVAHVNHKLRPQAEDEAAFVAQAAQKFHLPFYLCEEDVAARAKQEKISVELAGRQVRYRFFARIQQQTDARLVTGHHKDDQVETVLMHLLRGTGVAGLSGMQADGAVLRPLLGVSKQELIAYLEAEGIPWVQDASNLKTDYFRNRLRHELLPLLKQLQPGAEQALLTLSENARDAKEIMDDAVGTFLLQAQVQNDEILLPAALYHAQKSSMQRAILRATVLSLRGNEIDLTRAQTEEIRRVFQGVSGRYIALGELVFSVTQEGLLIRKKAEGQAFYLEISGYGEWAVPGGTLRVCAAVPDPVDLRRPNRLYLSEEDAQSLTLRTRQAGDRIRVFGSGGEKSLAKAMKDLKIRQDLRETWPLLCRGNQVYWIVGRQKSEETRLRPGTPVTVYEYIRKGDEDARL